MTTHRWVNKHLDFAVKRVIENNDIDEFEQNLQAVATRLRISPLENNEIRDVVDGAHGVRPEYSYFVSYRLTIDGHNGYGRTEIKRDAPICSIQDIEGMEAAISRENQAKIRIESWQRFEEPTCKGSGDDKNNGY